LGSNERFGTEACKRVLREVDALSGLKSDHVVRYYGAWVERGAIEAEDDPSTAQGGELSYTEENGSYEEYYMSSSERAERVNTDGVAIDNQEHRQYIDWEVSFENWGLLEQVLQPLDLCIECYKKSIPQRIDTEAIVIREKQRILPECLYILMGFAGNDLNDEIYKMAGKIDADTRKRRWHLFGQCVQGLHSIHQAAMIHRDIKCSNIFVNGDLATIGDLGLASVASAASAAAAASSETGAATASLKSVSSDVGTLLYSAPEVATGRYDDKCDILSRHCFD